MITTINAAAPTPIPMIASLDKGNDGADDSTVDEGCKDLVLLDDLVFVIVCNVVVLGSIL